MKRSNDNHPNEDLSTSTPLSSSRLGRRSFLLRSGAALATVTALAGLPYALRKELTRETSFVLFTPEQRHTVSVVQEHLFPQAPDSPGAEDINAAAYVEWVITTPGLDPDARNTIVNGVGRLQEASRERFSAPIYDLEFAEREQLLRYLADETRWGRAWLSLLLYYIFEALLADPVYGGNPDKVGWRWLEHQPGFPRPPADKIYGRLR